MGFISEFKQFALRGNVVDLAVGVVIGSAFGKILSSLIDDVITPLILTPALNAARLTNIGDLKWGTIKYGSFLSNIISFMIVAWVLFLFIKGMNTMKGKDVAPPAPPAPSKEELLLTEIRDLLKNK
jgi:large conductance mechanosensitive channel